MSANPAIFDHQAWLGYLQPDGLVVSPAALVDAQAILDRGQFAALQEKFALFVGRIAPKFGEDKPLPAITDLAAFLRGFLEWPDDCLTAEIPESLKLALAEGETLAPDFAFCEPKPADPARPWLMLIQQLPPGTEFDARTATDARSWNASPAQRFERLLRGVEVPIGLLSNGTELRLFYAPRGENSGSLTFPVAAMCEIAGRPILGALHMLLCKTRLLTGPRDSRLPALLELSRDYQASVSTTLAGQVLDALYELLRGFEHAHVQSGGTLLREVLARDPDELYAAQLTVLMRLVFVLFAEDRDLLPVSELYRRGYSVHGLFERLRVDAERYPDTLDLRYGAWSQLCVLFRLVHGGCKHPRMAMPARRGHLFDPDRFPFLESRADTNSPLPLVSDGTLYRVLEKLLILDGERLSYRTLDVEEIGSVYQTVMGFGLEIARGRTIALTGKRKHKSEVAAPVAINLDALLAIDAKDRAKWLKENAAHELTGNAGNALKQAASVEDLLAALEKRIARRATPHVVQSGGLTLQPTDERRRSGSHYTPRALTEPIVRKTLAPIFARLGERPTPQQILELKICDMAVGSGAFLVETCRQLGDALVEAWRVHGGRPPVPPDEDELLLARRLVAQRCLYGVDRNPMAVDLAKLSLWLATLARDHPFTFLDHALRGGDSLVGLSRRQLSRFHWDESARVEQFVFGQDELEKIIARVSKFRREILDGGDDMLPELKRQKLALADEELVKVRRAGDLCIRAFFEADSARARNARRDEALSRFGEAAAAARKGDMAPLLAIQNDVAVFRGEKPGGEKPVTPFHWEIEFPEVFDRENGGFDAIVGNPPFLGGTRISTVCGMPYFAYLTGRFPPAEHLCDLVAYFFRRAFGLLRQDAAIGLIASNTIAQGDTKHGGLEQICKDGGTIYAADKRVPWPGAAAVIVCSINILKGKYAKKPILNGKAVERISAYLFHAGSDAAPSRLAGRNDLFSAGSKIYGQGFLFADDDEGASPIAEMHRIVAENPNCRTRIFSYIGGDEVNSSPSMAAHRFVIYLSDLQTEEELAQWPELAQIVREKVKPERDKLGPNPNNVPLRRRWWAYQAHRPELYAALANMRRALVMSQTSKYAVFGFLPTGTIFSQKLNVFLIEDWQRFALLQSRAHEMWALFFGSTLEDRPVYTPTDCFETFPFPAGWETDAALQAAGREYYEFRAALMVRHNEGLTDTYNRFHKRDERDPGILRLRELHAEMDRAVLAAYGWSDLPTACEFIADYVEEGPDGDPVEKSIRYRWPDAVRDEVLARLLKLNAERAEEERLLGEAATEKPKKTKRVPKVSPAKTQLALGITTLSKGERALPAELRLAASEPLLYTTNLVVALLSEAGGSLPWTRLLDAYTLATNPSLMRKHCPAEEKSRVTAWATRWNEQVPTGLLLPSLNQLGGRNLTVTNDNEGRVFHLLDGPRRPATEDVGYDAWLALRIAAPLVPETLDIPKRAEWTAAAKKLVLA